MTTQSTHLYISNSELNKKDIPTLRVICDEKKIHYGARSKKRDLIDLIIANNGPKKIGICYMCKRLLPIAQFFFRNKEHKSCVECSERPKEKKGIDKRICEVCGKNAGYGHEEDGIRRRCAKCAKDASNPMINLV